MTRTTFTHPDRLTLGFGQSPELERVIEMRAELRAEAAAVRWRLRLALIEVVLIVAMIGLGGVLMGQPVGIIAQTAALVGSACLITGLLAIALSAATGALISRLRRAYVMRRLRRQR